MNIYLEIFGYIGTGLLLLSMAMTKLTMLRIMNISGSVISVIYAVLCNTWPVVFLNLGMIIINVIQLVRLYRNGKQKENTASDSNA